MKVKESFDRGVEKLRWYFSTIGERLRVEMAVIKLLGEIEDLEKQRNSLLQSVGERMLELKGRHNVNPQKEPAIREAFEELEQLGAKLKELRDKASEMGRVEE